MSILSPGDREVLESWTRSPSLRAGLAQRARIVSLAADGTPVTEIVRRVLDRRQLVAGAERSACDCPAEIAGDALIRAGSLRWLYGVRRSPDEFVHRRPRISGRHAGSQAAGGSLIGFRQSGGVHAECGGAASAMAEPPGDRADVHSGIDQLSGGVVPQPMQGGIDP